MTNYKYRIRPVSGFFIIERRKSLFGSWETISMVGIDVVNPSDEDYIRISEKATKNLKTIKKIDAIILKES